MHIFRQRLTQQLSIKAPMMRYRQLMFHRLGSFSSPSRSYMEKGFILRLCFGSIVVGNTLESRYNNFLIISLKALIK